MKYCTKCGKPLQDGAARHRTPQSRLLRQHRSRQHRLRLQPRQQPEQHSRQRSHRQPSLLSPRSRQQRFPRVC